MEQLAVPQARPSPAERVPWPFDRVRPGQSEFLTDAKAAIASGKHLLAHAPTGIGKTAVALVASLGVALETGKTVLFLTARQSQHRIAVETLKRLEAKGARVPAVDVISKQDMCLQPNRPEYGRAFHEFCELKVRTRACTFYNHDDSVVVTAVLQRALHVQELIRASASCHVCPHKVAMDAAERASVVVCDYNYVFSDILDWTLERIGKGLEDVILIVDEAHNLPDRIRNHLGGELSLTDMFRAIKEAKDLEPEAAHQLHGVAKSLEKFLLALPAERIAKKDELLDAVERGLRHGLGHKVTYTDLVEMVGHAAEEGVRRGRSTHLGDLEVFLRRWRDQDEGILRLVTPGSEGKFVIRLMDPSVLSAPIFARAHASVLMSGTLHPAEMYADLLGIPADRRWIRAYGSPFPKENRLLLVHPITTTLYAKRSEEMHDLIAREVVAIAAVAKGNVAAFFPSYELLQEAEGRVRSARLAKKMLVEHSTWDKAKRDGALEALRLARGEGGAVLLGVQGGSLSEGVDYEGNLLQAVVVVGLPLSPPNLEVESLKDYYQRKFGFAKGYDYAYVFPAVNKVLQAAGRPIRSERDRAAIVLLEGRFLAQRYQRCLPAEFAPRTSAAPSREVAHFLNATTAATSQGDATVKL